MIDPVLFFAVLGIFAVQSLGVVWLGIIAYAVLQELRDRRRAEAMQKLATFLPPPKLPDDLNFDEECRRMRAEAKLVASKEAELQQHLERQGPPPGSMHFVSRFFDPFTKDRIKPVESKQE